MKGAVTFSENFPREHWVERDTYYIADVNKALQTTRLLVVVCRLTWAIPKLFGYPNLLVVIQKVKPNHDSFH